MTPNPDWTKLPAEFSYITSAAERYGPLLASSSGHLYRRPRRREMEELQKVSDQIGWHNHYLPLQSWCIEFLDAAEFNKLPETELVECDLIDGLLSVLCQVGLEPSDYGPKQEPDWTLAMWDTLHYRLLHALVEHTRDVLADEEAFEVAAKALDRVPARELPDHAFVLLHAFQSYRALDWIEAHVPETVTPWHWGWLAAVSGMSWPRASAWLRRGRPLSLVALDALANMDGNSESPVVQKADPKLGEPVPIVTAEQTLRDYARNDPVPRVKLAVEKILKGWDSITGNESARFP